MPHPENMLIASPLPQRYLTDDEGIGGRIKVRPADFLVEEIPLYEPCGEGEHLYLQVEKMSVAHGELMAVIRKHFSVREGAIGYAGMKDKQAVSRQMISVHVLQDPPSLEFSHDRIRVLWAKRHANKLRRGHLKGNRFSIRIREVDPGKVDVARRVLARLSADGVPTYFGPQRFGYRCNNHLLGAMLLNGQWGAALAELLGSRGSPFPEYQRQRRELFDAGRYDEAAGQWSPADRSELIACRKLCAGGSPQEAIEAVGRITLNFYASALVSAAFNRILDQRIDDGTVGRLLEGDLAWKHDSRAVFPVTAAELATGELPPRLERFGISPSGPLWGQGITLASGRIVEVEREALAATGVSEQLITTSRFRPEGGRRPFRVPMENINVSDGEDKYGPYILVALDLPRGTYATVALREIMKTDDPGAEMP